MYPFHKPKTYRSVTGCCICRAKSSSSRFTSSAPYEPHFEKCFKVDDGERQGEICNACVLIVKRRKKLEDDDTRDWAHVVDARAGPGTKSMSKIKNRSRMAATDTLPDERYKKKHRRKVAKKRLMLKSSAAAVGGGGGGGDFMKVPGSPSQFSDDIGDECMSMPSDEVGYTSDVSDATHSSGQSSGKRHKSTPSPYYTPSFIRPDYWTRTETCCGTVFEGLNGECIIDASLWHPCRRVDNPCKQATPSRASSTVSVAPVEPAYGHDDVTNTTIDCSQVETITSAAPTQTSSQQQQRLRSRGGPALRVTDQS